MKHLLLDNTLLQLLARGDISKKLTEKQQLIDRFAESTFRDTPFTLIVPMALVIEFLGFRAPDTAALKKRVHAELSRALDGKSEPAKRSELLASVYSEVHSFFVELPTVKEFPNHHPMPTFRSTKIASGVAAACRIAGHPRFPHHLAGLLARDYIQALVKPKGKLSTPDAAEQVLHGLKMYEADADGVRVFPLKIIDALLQSFRLLNCSWPPPQELRVKERKDLNDSAYLDFAWRGWWKEKQRHPVTVYTCEDRDTVQDRCIAFKAVIEGWNDFVKNQLSPEQQELIFKLKPGRIVCLDRNTFAQVWAKKMADIR